MGLARRGGVKWVVERETGKARAKRWDGGWGLCLYNLILPLGPSPLTALPSPCIPVPSSFRITFPQMHGPGLALLSPRLASFLLLLPTSSLESVQPWKIWASKWGEDGKIVESFLSPSPGPAHGDKQQSTRFLHTAQNSTQFSTWVIYFWNFLFTIFGLLLTRDIWNHGECDLSI